MSQGWSQHLERNPFATRYVRPGAVSFQFVDGQSPVQIVERLQSSQWMGEIVGPHGSGKSTLLQSLIPILQDRGREVKAFTLHLGESQLPSGAGESKDWQEDTQLVIDGYEQLSNKSRSQILKACRNCGCGLLVTSHESTGLPFLFGTEVSVELVQTLVHQLQEGGETRVGDADVALSFARHQGNVRDVFFELYDMFEQRRPV